MEVAGPESFAGRWLVGPDADVVGLKLEPHAIAHFERLGHLARQLEPAGPVKHGVLDGVPESRPVTAVVPQGLRAGPPSLIAMTRRTFAETAGRG